MFARELCVVGVDGGASRTRVASWCDGETAWQGAGPASNPSVSGVSAAMEVISTLIDAALDARSGRTPDLIGVGLAGVGPAQRGWRGEIEAMLSLRHGCAVGVWNDAEAGLAGATGGKPGILLIGGTGSTALGFDGRDSVVQTGGWGRGLRDAGSGHEIFQRFAQLLLLAQEEGESSFEEGPRVELLRALGIEDSKGMIPIFAEGPDPEQIAACCRILFEAVGHDDFLALELLEEAGADLLGLALRCRKGLRARGALPLCLHGGLLERQGPVRDALERGLESRAGTQLHLADPLAGPEAGAVLLTLDRTSETELRPLRLALA